MKILRLISKIIRYVTGLCNIEDARSLNIKIKIKRAHSCPIKGVREHSNRGMMNAGRATNVTEPCAQLHGN